MTFTRRNLLICAAASPLAAVISCGPTNAEGDGDSDASPASVNHQVQIKGFVFEPESLRVKAGDTITFTNLDIVPYTATAKDKSWDTGNLAQNEAATITVAAGMVTDYFCIYHPNMVARLQFA